MFNKKNKKPKQNMAIEGPFLFFFLFLAFALASTVEAVKLSNYSIPFNRSSFPADFVFGAGSAAYQV